MPLPLRASRHAPGMGTAEDAGEQIGEEQEGAEEEDADMDQGQQQEFLFPIGESYSKNALSRDIIENWENLEEVMVKGITGARIREWIDTVTQHIVTTGKAIELKYVDSEHHGDVGGWDAITFDCGKIPNRTEATTSLQFITKARGLYQRALEARTEREQEGMAYQLGKVEAAVNLLMAECGLATYEENKRVKKKKREIQERNKVKQR